MLHCQMPAPHRAIWAGQASSERGAITRPETGGGGRPFRSRADGSCARRVPGKGAAQSRMSVAAGTPGRVGSSPCVPHPVVRDCSWGARHPEAPLCRFSTSPEGWLLEAPQAR